MFSLWGGCWWKGGHPLWSVDTSMVSTEPKFDPPSAKLGGPPFLLHSIEYSYHCSLQLIVEYTQAMLESELNARQSPPSVFMPAPTSSESTAPFAPGLVLRPVLPQTLWPHSFLYFTAIMTVVLGILNPLTLTTTIAAFILAGRVRD